MLARIGADGLWTGSRQPRMRPRSGERSYGSLAHATDFQVKGAQARILWSMSGADHVDHLGKCRGFLAVFERIILSALRGAGADSLAHAPGCQVELTVLLRRFDPSTSSGQASSPRARSAEVIKTANQQAWMKALTPQRIMLIMLGNARRIGRFSRGSS